MNSFLRFIKLEEERLDIGKDETIRITWKCLAKCVDVAGRVKLGYDADASQACMLDYGAHIFLGVDVSWRIGAL